MASHGSQDDPSYAEEPPSDEPRPDESPSSESSRPRPASPQESTPQESTPQESTPQESAEQASAEQASSPDTEAPRTSSRDPASAPAPRFVESTIADPWPENDRSAYHGNEVLEPPAYTTGRYQTTSVPPSTHPPDPILPFVAPPVPRRRRSDWPVLLAALIISAVVLAACCVAGYTLYVSKGPLFR